MDDELKNILLSIQSDVQNIKTDIQNIKTDVLEVKERIGILEVKQTVMGRKLDDINYQVTSMDYMTRKGFQKLNDEMETVVQILTQNELIPN